MIYSVSDIKKAQQTLSINDFELIKVLGKGAFGKVKSEIN